MVFARLAWAWFAQGHEIVAIIAADDMTPTARLHVAQILGVPDDTSSVEKGMAAASIRPDTEFRDEDRASAQWHFIDICLQDHKTDLSARCPEGNCVIAKIDEYERRLREGNYDKWGAKGDLAFPIHLVGDIHPTPAYDYECGSRRDMPTSERCAGREESSLRLGRCGCHSAGEAAWDQRP
jgi:hypothetical protein